MLNDKMANHVDSFRSL